ncbi:MAG: hypothetical protein B7X47_00365 [Ferrovum sp. 34-44-207]|jgi:O-antigen ligase|nr:MAG: hypothetical protein B7X47_00365 [Ferrovum sp. 34-44-207]
MKIIRLPTQKFIPETFNQDRLSSLIYILITLSPIVFFTYERAFGEWYKLISILCVTSLIIQKDIINFNWRNNKLSLMIFVIYPVVILINQLLRWDWHIHEYLDKLRFLFAIPIFIYLSEKKFNFMGILEKSLPIALILSYVSTNLFFLDRQYGDRFTDLFLNPIYYGEITLSMSMILLATFFISHNKNIYINCLKVIGFLMGIYISVKTGSRTGWENLIIIPILLILFKRKNLKTEYQLLFLLLFMAGLILLIKYNQTVSLRLSQAYLEIKNYPWSGGMAPVTSVGQRITFYRIGWDLMLKEPWYGWGQKGYGGLLLRPELLSFSAKETLLMTYYAHFHNELLTLIVWYGVFGPIIYLINFIFPVVNAIKVLKTQIVNEVTKNNSLILIVFLVTQIVAGLSDMVILFKYMIMFYSFMMACLLASVHKKEI